LRQLEIGSSDNHCLALGGLGHGVSKRDRQPVADWLLRPFPPEVDVGTLVDRGSECTLAVVREGVDVAMRRWNGVGPM